MRQFGEVAADKFKLKEERFKPEMHESVNPMKCFPFSKFIKLKTFTFNIFFDIDSSLVIKFVEMVYHSVQS